MSKFWEAVEEAVVEKGVGAMSILEDDLYLDEVVVRVMEIIPWPCSFGVGNPGLIHPVDDGESFVLMDAASSTGLDLHITTFSPRERVIEVLTSLSDNQGED